MASLSPETVRDAFRRLFPHPCTSRYTAIAMVPRPPSLLQRLVAGVVEAVHGSSGGTLLAAGAVVAAVAATACYAGLRYSRSSR